MEGASVTVEIFVFCCCRFSNQFDIVLETRFSGSTVGRELAVVSYTLPASVFLKRTGTFVSESN